MKKHNKDYFRKIMKERGKTPAEIEEYIISHPELFEPDDAEWVIEATIQTRIWQRITSEVGVTVIIFIGILVFVGIIGYFAVNNWGYISEKIKPSEKIKITGTISSGEDLLGFKLLGKDKNQLQPYKLTGPIDDMGTGEIFYVAYGNHPLYTINMKNLFLNCNNADCTLPIEPIEGTTERPTFVETSTELSNRIFIVSFLNTPTDDAIKTLQSDISGGYNLEKGDIIKVIIQGSEGDPFEKTYDYRLPKLGLEVHNKDGNKQNKKMKLVSLDEKDFITKATYDETFRKEFLEELSEYLHRVVDSDNKVDFVSYIENILDDNKRKYEDKIRYFDFFINGKNLIFPSFKFGNTQKTLNGTDCSFVRSRAIRKNQEYNDCIAQQGANCSMIQRPSTSYATYYIQHIKLPQRPTEEHIIHFYLDSQFNDVNDTTCKAQLTEVLNTFQNIFTFSK